MEDPDGTVMITGAPVTGTVASGARKGRKRYGTPRHALVTDAEMLAERRRYEREEGKCAECGGDGQMFAKWDHREGTTYRPCVKCQATGKPLSADAVDPHVSSTGKPSTRVRDLS
jgi:hypothetical protein